MRAEMRITRKLFGQPVIEVWYGGEIIGSVMIAPDGPAILYSSPNTADTVFQTTNVGHGVLEIRVLAKNR